MRGLGIIGFVLLGSPAIAEECEQPLELRSVTPGEAATDIPIDSRVLVSFIGQGSADEFQVNIQANGEELPALKDSWCYPHEGPFEVHCWWAINPEETLPENQEIEVRIESTSSFQGDTPIGVSNRFTTGVGVTELNLAGAPVLEMLEVVDIPESELTDCDFDEPRRAIIQVDSELSDPNGLAVIQIEELAVDGSYFKAHTVFMTLAAPPNPDHHNMIKQFVDLGAPYTGCYRISAEDGAGIATESGEICWPEYGDTSVDTGQHTTSDTEQETGGETGIDSGEDSGSYDPEPTPPNLTCACSTSGLHNKALWFWGIVVLGFVRWRP